LEIYFEIGLQNWILNTFSPCTYKKAKYIKTSGLRAQNINKEIIMQRKQQTNKNPQREGEIRRENVAGIIP